MPQKDAEKFTGLKYQKNNKYFCQFMLENDVYKALKTVYILHLQVRPGKKSRKWCLHKMPENENVKQSQ